MSHHANIECDIGETVVFTATFRDSETDALTDPDAVTAKAKRRGVDGESDLDVDRASQGVYEARLEPDADGAWDVRFVGTGDTTAVAVGSLVARKTEFATS